MAMKKTSGGDSCLWHGAGKSFWTLPISDRRRRRIAMCFWKIDRVFRFSRRGVFIGEGATSEVDHGGLTHRGRRPGVGRAALWCGQPVAPLRLLFGLLEALVNIRRFGFCFVQFREYFLCNFSKTQKQQKNRELTLWHLVNRLVPENV
jgi:hypothetical protein